METLPLPQKIEYKKDDKNENKGEIIIEPCFPGYGTTWGNALRRVLLSSLAGGAVTAVKIKGVKHEFSTIPFVKGDVLEIILNLKQLRMKIFSEGEIRLSLKAEGEKKVYAKDIEKNSQVEVANPNLLIATLTDKKAKFEAEIFVKKGIGYIPVEEKKDEEKEIGKILIDSIFTPIRNVGLRIENVRVGEKTNFDRLTIPIETDGIITPLEAFVQTTELLKDQFSYIAKEVKSLVTSETKEKKEKKEKKTKTKIKKKKAKKK